MTMQIGTDEPHYREPNGEHGSHRHTVCSVDCPCGHWRGGRHATSRHDGRRGRVTLDVIDNAEPADWVERGSR